MLKCQCGRRIIYDPNAIVQKDPLTIKFPPGRELLGNLVLLLWLYHINTQGSVHVLEKKEGFIIWVCMCLLITEGSWQWGQFSRISRNFWPLFFFFFGDSMPRLHVSTVGGGTGHVVSYSCFALPCLYAGPKSKAVTQNKRWGGVG